MKKQISIIAALLLAVCGLVRADTSYLLIQGPFGTSGTVETFKLAVNYTPGSITTGFNLLTTALTSEQLQYTTSTYGAYVTGFTLGGTSVANGVWTTNADYSGSGLVWTYYTANAGSWTYSDIGASSRTITNGSYDGWVYGLSAYDSSYNQTAVAVIDGAENTPTAENFATATQVEAVPEPGSVALLFAGAGTVLALRRKLRKS